MNLEKSVPFDPGYSQHSYQFSENIEAVYNVLKSIKTPHQKKFQFKVFQPKIVMMYENSVAFYLGCLLWASYIKKAFSEAPKEISDNNFYDKEIDDDIFSEINCLTDYFSQYEKDCKYYLSKPCLLNEEWLRIINVYKDFLTVNDNFKKVKDTSDLRLPKEIKDISPQDLSIILEKIEAVTVSGKLEELFEVKDLVV